MVVIQVNKEDKVKVFEILSSNGRFVGLPDNKFSIIEHSEEVLKKISSKDIKYTIVD